VASQGLKAMMTRSKTARRVWVGPDDRGLESEIVAIVLGPDIDLDVEVVRDEKKGRRITEARAQRLAEEAMAKSGVGRPSLTAPGARSPEVKARVPAELKDRYLRGA
jgi:hypothetical protein